MRTFLKTLAWLLVSGTIIFFSNIFGGVEWKLALYGAAVAKIGTTIAYYFHELAWVKWDEFVKSRQNMAEDCNLDIDTLKSLGTQSNIELAA